MDRVTFQRAPILLLEVRFLVTASKINLPRFVLLLLFLPDIRKRFRVIADQITASAGVTPFCLKLGYLRWLIQ